MISWPELRYAARSLVRARGYSSTVVLTLALGIGANTAIFSVVDGVLLKPLPYPEADALVAVAELPPSGVRNTVAPVSFLEWQAGARSFAGLAARQSASFLITEGGDPEEARGARVSTSYFDVLRVAPSRGRSFTEADGQPGAPCVVLLSDRLWVQRWARDPGVVGRSVRVSDTSCAVIGILPANSVFDRVPFQLYTPLTFTRVTAPRGHFLTVVGRLRNGVSVAQAQAEMEALARNINAADANKADWSAAVVPWRTTVVRSDARTLVLVLFGAVAVVLLVACVNIASLTISRAVARRREVAIRRAIGAGLGRLLALYVSEAALVSAAGGALGLLVAQWCLRVFLALAPAGSLPTEAAVSLDWRVLLFTAGLVLAVSLFFGSVPAWQAIRTQAADVLRDAGRGLTMTGLTRRLQNGLLVVQVALAMVLVTGAAFLTVSFSRLIAVDPGFDPVGAQTFRVPLLRTASPDDAARFHENVIGQLRQLPGVESAGAATSLPLRGWLFGTTVRVVGLPPFDPARRSVHVQHVIGNYFEALRMPMREGRPLASSDHAAAPRAVVVNETFVRRFLSDGRAVGRQVILGITDDGASENTVAWDIVGVVRDVKTGGLADAELLTPEVYVPYVQSPQAVPPQASFAYVVRARGSSATVSGASIREAVRRVDAQAPVSAIITLETMVGDSVVNQRFRTLLIMAFALVTLMVAALGVYAVRAQAVAARQREVGIRIALGATRRQIRHSHHWPGHACGCARPRAGADRCLCREGRHRAMAVRCERHGHDTGRDRDCRAGRRRARGQLAACSPRRTGTAVRNVATGLTLFCVLNAAALPTARARSRLHAPARAVRVPLSGRTATELAQSDDPTQADRSDHAGKLSGVPAGGWGLFSARCAIQRFGPEPERDFLAGAEVNWAG